MLKRFLQLTPGKGGSQSSETDQQATNANESSEGFICPQCMKAHNSAEELFKHYELFHDSDTPPSQPPSREDLVLLRQEVQDLHTSLKEERWFSGELKKELDKVQGQLKQNDSQASTDESDLEMKLNEAEAEKFNIKQMKDLFEQKAAQLATEIVDIKARYDEEKSLREAAEQQVSRLKQELERERQERKELHTELLQRPGVEDVDVLKKELVQVQTLMDNMTREREEESERLKGEFQRLHEEHKAAETVISQLRSELEKGPQEAAVYTKQIQQLQLSLAHTQQQHQSLQEKLVKKEKEFSELQERLSAEQTSRRATQSQRQQQEAELQQLQAQVTASQASLQRAQTELGERGEASGRMREELSELEVKHQQLKAEHKQLQQQREEREQQVLQQQSEISQLHSKLLETERQLGEVHGRLKEQRQLSGEKLKDREQQVAELQLKLSRVEEQVKEQESKATDLQHQLDKSRQQHQEAQTLQQSTTGKLREAQNDLEQVLRQIGDKDQKIQNLEALLQKSRESVVQLETERQDLCAKIQAGEGETAVLNQLQEKNHALQEQVAQLTDKLRNQSESHKQAQENLHEQLQEQKTHLRAAQDRCLSLESTNGELNTQLGESRERNAQLDTQLKAKTEMLLSLEAAKSAQRADLQNHLETAQHALQDKQQELQKVQTRVEELNAKLQEKQEMFSQLETNLKECKEKLLSSEQTSESLHAQIKKAGAEVQDLRVSRDQAQSDLQQSRRLNSETHDKAKELSRLLGLEKEGAAALQEEVKRKSLALEEAQHQLQQSKEQLRRVTQEGQEQRVQLEQKATGLADLLKTCQHEKDTRSQELSSARDSLSTSSQELEKLRTQLDQEKKRSQGLLQEKENVYQRSMKELQCKADVAAKEASELRGQIKQKDEAEKALKAQLVQRQTSQQEKEKLTQQLQEELKNIQETAQREKKKLDSKVEEMQALHAKQVELESKLKEQLNRTTQDLKAEKSQHAELQQNHASVRESLAQTQSDCYGKESELLALRQDLKAFEEKLVLKQEELVGNQKQLRHLEEKLEEESAAKAELERDAAKRTERTSELERSVQELQQLQKIKRKELEKEKLKTEELNECNRRLEKNVSQLGEEMKANGERWEKEVKELCEAKKLLIQQKVEMQTRVESAQADVQREQQEHQATRNVMCKVEQELQETRGSIQAQQLEEKKAKAELVKRHEEAESKQTMQITALNENMSTLKREWQSSQRRVGELEKQTDELRGEIAVLEATVQNNQDERRALLERCVKGEGEIEKLQGKAVEMRRKLDDMTAAMQELGRENQSLQIKQSQSLTRKWAEDHEVQNCMSCGKGFSVTIRKHHCRHCGNIFCAECSARCVLTPSSKKPVRVCDTCFDELQG